MEALCTLTGRPFQYKRHPDGELMVYPPERDGGLQTRSADRLPVDMGYKPGIVADVERKGGGAAMMLSKGVGIRASRKPLSAYARHPGEVHGPFGYVPSVRKTGEYPHVLVDVNY